MENKKKPPKRNKKAIATNDLLHGFLDNDIVNPVEYLESRKRKLGVAPGERLTIKWK